MFRISSEKELLNCFRPIDQAEVISSGDLLFPIDVKDYFTWDEPSGARIYLIFKDRNLGLPFGVVFRRDQSNGVGRLQMCEWCHSMLSGEGVTLLTATASKQRRVGLYLCRDLGCREKGTSVLGGSESFVLEQSPERVQKIVQRMGDFARHELF